MWLGRHERGDALRNGLSLGAAARGEIKRLAAAEPFRLDAFDVAMPDQQDLGHDFISRTRCSVKRCAADLGIARNLGVFYDPGSAAHHFVLRCARDTGLQYA